MSLPSNWQGELLTHILRTAGGIAPHLNSYNHFLNQIGLILASYKVQLNPGNVWGEFSNPIFSFPHNTELTAGKGTKTLMYPAHCRQNNTSYLSEVYCTFSIYAIDPNTGQKVLHSKPSFIFIGKIPVMLHSRICNLYGKTPEQRYQLGESISDPGGYFIIKGAKKLLLKKESLRTNLPLMYEDKKEYVVRYTAKTLTESTVVIVKDTKMGVHVTFTKMGIADHHLNIFILFYILGLTENTVETSMKFIESFVVDEKPERMQKRRSFLRQFLTMTIVTFNGYASEQNKIFSILGSAFTKLPEYNKTDYGPLIQLIRREFFSNIAYDYNEPESTMFAKIKMLGYMVAKLADFHGGFRELDDRDSWEHKSLIDQGEHMAFMFNLVWKKMIEDFNSDIKDKKLAEPAQLAKTLKVNTLAERFVSSFVQGQWVSAKGSKEVPIADTLKEDNLMALYAHLSRVIVMTNRKAKIVLKRFVSFTQWGAICPNQTPEGEGCGLVKYLAMLAVISLNRDDKQIYDALIRENHVTPQLKSGYFNSLFLNGVHVGYCNSKVLYEQLILTRRKKKIAVDTGLVLDTNSDIWIMTTPGRICRPLMIVNQKTGRLVLEEKNLKGQPLNRLMEEGAIEYIDIAEQQYPRIYIAATLKDLEEKRQRIEESYQNYLNVVQDATATDEMKSSAKAAWDSYSSEKKYTHAEVHPAAILGIAAGSIIYPETAPGPRITYQSGMETQALGPDISRIQLSFPTSFKMLLNPDVPLVGTEVKKALGFEEAPTGKNLIMAINIYGGSNQEDSVVLNKASVDMGKFKVAFYYSYKATICQRPTHSERLEMPKDIKPSDLEKYSKLDKSTNIVRIGERVKVGDCLVAKVIVPNDGSGPKNDSLFVEIKKDGVVDEVFITENSDGCKMIRIRLRDIRDPEVGDKMAMSPSQKGTIGEIIPPEDMPQVVHPDPYLNGIIPDIIFNPHGFPSRMTIGIFYQALSGWLATLTGKRINATAFSGADYNQIKAKLEEFGFKNQGKVPMINGKNGEMLQAQIFMGPVSYSLLRHFVHLKSQARATGKVQALVRQPVEGMRKEGGTRFGEMEQGALIEYGATEMLRDRMMFSSDVYRVPVCENCGTIAIAHAQRGEFKCNSCKQSSDFVVVTIPYIFKLFVQLVSGFNIKLTMKTRRIQ